MPAWAGPVWYGCRTGPVLPPVGPARPDDLVGPGRHRSPGTPRRSALPSPPPLACISTSPAHPTRNRSRPISPLLAPDLHRRINSAPYAIVRRASAAPGTRTRTIYGVRLRGGTCRGPDGSHSDFGLSNSTSSHRHTIPQGTRRERRGGSNQPVRCSPSGDSNGVRIPKATRVFLPSKGHRSSSLTRVISMRKRFCTEPSESKRR